MGFFSDFKAKRADKAATLEFQHLHSVSEEDRATLEKLVTIFTAASKGEDSVPNTLMQKPGEVTLWTGNGVFHEVGKTPTRYAGRSSGVSVPVVAGIRFRVGAMQGTAIPGVELQMDKDEDQSDYFISVSNRQKTSGVRFFPSVGREFNLHPKACD